MMNHIIFTDTDLQHPKEVFKSILDLPPSLRKELTSILLEMISASRDIEILNTNVVREILNTNVVREILNTNVVREILNINVVREILNTNQYRVERKTGVSQMVVFPQT